MYSSLRACVTDLEHTGQLARIEQEIDPHLEAALALPGRAAHSVDAPAEVRFRGTGARP